MGALVANNTELRRGPIRLSACMRAVSPMTIPIKLEPMSVSIELSGRVCHNPIALVIATNTRPANTTR